MGQVPLYAASLSNSCCIVRSSLMRCKIPSCAVQGAWPSWCKALLPEHTSPLQLQQQATHRPLKSQITFKPHLPPSMKVTSALPATQSPGHDRHFQLTCQACTCCLATRPKEACWSPPGYPTAGCATRLAPSSAKHSTGSGYRAEEGVVCSVWGSGKRLISGQHV